MRYELILSVDFGSCVDHSDLHMGLLNDLYQMDIKAVINYFYVCLLVEV